MNFTLIRENIVIMAYIGLISSKFLINYYVVIILVVLAINFSLSLFFAYNTLFESLSITIAASALIALQQFGKIANNTAIVTSTFFIESPIKTYEKKDFFSPLKNVS